MKRLNAIALLLAAILLAAGPSFAAGVGQFVVYHTNNPSATRVANYT